MEQGSKNFCVKQIDAEGVGRAAIARLDVIDRDQDVIRPGAFGLQHVVVVPAHNSHVVPLGKAVVSEKGGEAFGDFALNTDTQSGKEWASHLKFDLENGQPVQEWSFRFDIVQDSKGDHDGRPVRFLEKLKVLEISPVLQGAGIGTRTVSIKDRDDSTEIIREFCGAAPETLSFEQLHKAIGRLNGVALAEVIDEPWMKHRNRIYDAIATLLRKKSITAEPAALKTVEEMEAALGAMRELLRFELSRGLRHRNRIGA